MTPTHFSKGQVDITLFAQQSKAESYCIYFHTEQGKQAESQPRSCNQVKKKIVSK